YWAGETGIGGAQGEYAGIALDQLARTGNRIRNSGTVRTIKDEGAIHIDRASRQGAIGIVVADLEGAAVDADAAGEIIGTAVIQNQGAGALFFQAGDAADFSDAA